MSSPLSVALCCATLLGGCASRSHTAPAPSAGVPPTARAAAATSATSAKARAAALRTTLERLTTYTAELAVVMDAGALFSSGGRHARSNQLKMRMHTSIAVQRPRRMRLRVTSERLSMVAYLDGEHAYVGTQLPAAKGTVKPMRLSHVAQSKVATSARPFDVGFNIRGHGLDQGADLVETLTTLLGTYHFRGRPRRRTVAGKTCREIVGTRTLDQALTSVLDDPVASGALLLAAQSDARNKALGFSGLRGLAKTTCEFLQATSYARVCIGDDGMPRRYTLGRQHSPVITVTITKLQAKATLPISTFRPDARRRAAATDVTKSVQDQRQQMHAASAEKALAARVEATLRRCGNARTSQPRIAPSKPSKPSSTVRGPLPSAP